MLYFISKKEGFHEDEIFSYGSSNYIGDNMFQPYGKQDSINKVLVEKVVNSNFIQNFKNARYYLKHLDSFISYVNSVSDTTPVWKTSDEAKEYVTIKNDIPLKYNWVYFNQSRDAHPPLFYMLVHTVSYIFKNTFSKYIIFTINLVFFVLSCIVIYNIFKILNKNYLSILTLLFYGLSMGALSTVLYQRMYMLLTFFVLYYLYVNLKIYKSGYKLTKRLKIELFFVILLGFLNHYYFCVYVFIFAILMIIFMLKEKLYNRTIQYIKFHFFSSLLGVLLFPASIYHIFFSYRGINNLDYSLNYFETLISHIQTIFKAFTLPDIIGCFLIFALAILLFLKVKKTKNKQVIILFVIPIILYVLIISKIAPYIELRYVMCVLPIICICIILSLDNITRNKKLNILIISFVVFIISINGFMFGKPDFLYSSYSKNLDIAKENASLRFVYVGTTAFNHIQSIPEFMVYDYSLILNNDQLDLLKTDESLSNETTFILSIKNYFNVDMILIQVLENTGYSKYELLLNDNKDNENVIYKIER